MPLLLDDLCVIREAQRVRCMDIDAVHLTRKLALAGWMLVPLVVSSFRRAREIEIALQARATRDQPGGCISTWGREGLSSAKRVFIEAFLALKPAAARLKASPDTSVRSCERRLRWQARLLEGHSRPDRTPVMN